jgi:segregation and condensation protein A
MGDGFDFDNLEIEKPEVSIENTEDIQNREKIGQNQFFDMITNQEVGWQTIIFDLVRTEQLDPWNINITILADKYMEVIQKMEEANFFVSSKVLLACALLLRLKSEILVNRDLPSLDEAIYGKKETKKVEPIRIDIDEEDLPLLIPKTPLPRSKKVSLQELMQALSQAIETENRRIRKEIKVRQAQKATEIVMPHLNRIPLKDRIKSIYSLIFQRLGQEMIEMKYSELAPSREEKIISFLPVLHLYSEEKLHTHQEKHFDDILLSIKRLRNEEYLPYSIKEDKIQEEHFEKFVEKDDEEVVGENDSIGNLAEDLEVKEELKT